MSEQLFFALQLILVLVFGASVVGKLRDPGAFVKVVRDYELPGRRSAPLIAAAVVVAEVILLVFLLTGLVPVVPVALGLALTGCFAVGISWTLRRGLDIACGCLGDSRERVTPRTLVRLALLWLAFAAMGLILVLDQEAPRSAAGSLGSGISAEFLAQSLLLVAALGAVALWILEFKALAALFRALRHRPIEAVEQLGAE